MRSRLILAALGLTAFAICSIIAGVFFGFVFVMIRAVTGLNPPTNLLGPLSAIAGLALAFKATDIIRRRFRRRRSVATSFCGRCGSARVSPDDAFCRSCGKPYSSDKSYEATHASPQPSPSFGEPRAEPVGESAAGTQIRPFEATEPARIMKLVKRIAVLLPVLMLISAGTGVLAELARLVLGMSETARIILQSVLQYAGVSAGEKIPQ